MVLENSKRKRDTKGYSTVCWFLVNAAGFYAVVFVFITKLGCLFAYVLSLCSWKLAVCVGCVTLSFNSIKFVVVFLTCFLFMQVNIMSWILS